MHSWFRHPSLCSLRTRLMLLFFLAVIPALGSILYTATAQRQSAAIEAQENLLRLVKVAAANQRQTTEAARQLLIALAQMPDIRQRNVDECDRLLVNLLKQYHFYAGFGVVDGAGNLICSAPVAKKPINVSDRPYFRLAKETHDFAIGEFQIGRITGKPTLNFAYPILNRSGQVQAVVVAALDLAWFDRLAGEMKLPQGSTVTVTDRQGTILIRYPDSQKWMGKSVPNAPMTKVVLSQIEGTAEAMSLDGIQRFYAFTTLGTNASDRDVHIRIGVPKLVVFTQADRLLGQNLMVLGCVTVLALTVAWVGGDVFLTRKVKSLVQTTQKIQSGDFTARSELAGEAGELGQLGRAFNEMAAALEAREQAIASLNQDMQTLFEVIPIGVLLSQDPEFKHVKSNPAFAAILGLAVDANVSYTPANAPPPAYKLFQGDRELTLNEFPLRYAAIHKTEIKGTEVDIVRGDGSVFNLFGYAKPLLNKQGAVRGSVAAFLDITERKRTEETLRRTNQTLQTLIDVCPVAIAFFDPQGIVRLWNRAAEGIFGWSAQEAIGRFMPTVPHRQKEFLASLETVLSGRSLNGFEVQHQAKDGRMVDLEIWANLTHDVEGNSGCLGIAWDISERKQVETALRTSEERYRLLVLTTAALVWTTDANGAFINSQPAWEAYTGQSWEQYAGWGWLEMIHPQDREELKARWEHSLTKRAFYEVEGRLWHAPSGEYRHIIARAVPLFNADGSVREWIGMDTDIHERKQAESALRQSEARFQVLVSNMPGIVYRYAPFGDGNGTPAFTYVSSGSRELAELEPETILQDANSFLSLIHPDDLPSFEYSVANAVKNSLVWQWEGRIITPSGKLKWIQGRSRPEQTEYGEAWDGLFFDITERKQAEAELSEQRHLLEIILNNAADAILVCDASGKVTFANPQARRLAQQDPNSTALDLDVSSWGTAYDVEGSVIPLENYAISRALRGEVNNALESRMVRADGSYYDILASAAPLLKDGQIVGAVANLIDISDRRRTQEALRRSKERFRISQELSLDAFTILESVRDETGAIVDFVCIYLNPKAAEIIQRPVQDSIGQRLLQVLPGHKTKSELFERYVKVVETGVAHDIELFYNADGIVSWFRNMAVKLEDGVAISFSDITQRKQAEAEREQLLAREQAAREQAEAANRIKDEFLAVLSHELRSPLNPILGWAKLLQSGKLDAPSRQRALETIERNAKLQTQLIDDLLDVSRILRGKIALKIYPVNPVQIIESALETVQLAAEAKQIQIETAIALNNAKISGDSARLQQIVWNLLSNAIKFTPNSGKVEIRLEQVNNYAQIQVKDTGIGITPDFLPFVFDYFRQEDSKITRKFGGLGLGLAIVRHLTELHGGTIHAQSQGEGQGATFTVKLPLMVVATAPEPEISATTQLIDFSQLQILVVDDEADMRDLVRFILEQQGAQVTIAASAAEALMLFERQAPHILISDLGMPDMDGYTLMQQIRSRSPQQGAKIPAIALSAYAGEYDQQQALKVGFHKHIAKPVEPEVLINAISELLKEARGRRQKAGGFYSEGDSDPS
ncbi:MAG: PAS domain S-box protein [Nostoc sp. ChiSLP02]|nr:PAS domain S-box protein [Nostoc sp. DedSLP05]MDZ8103060.1 PAS domain S-box protein [Nostoc sp. DedSLP01]MDZ8183383.1 PAS domain S-box protein [Nostoc sp. ChiSLP02]